MTINQPEPVPLSNDYYFLLQSLIYDSTNDILSLEDQIISLVEKGSQKTIKYIEFLLSKTSRTQFWKIPSLFHLSTSLESHLKIKLKLEHLLFKFIKYNQANPDGSFSDFCITQADDKWKDLISILSTDDSDKLTESHFQDKDLIIFDSRKHALIDLLWKFRSEKCIQKFKVDKTKVDLSIGLKCQTRDDFIDEKPVKYFSNYSRQSWFFDLFGSTINDFYMAKYNYSNLIIPTQIAKEHFLYGPYIVRTEVRRSIFGEETGETYKKLIHYADLIWKKEDFEFESNMPEHFVSTLLNDVISLYCINHPKEYEHILNILLKLSPQITDKIFHSLTDRARILKPMMVKIGCDFRTQAEKDYVFFPYDEDIQVHDRDFIDYFHKNYPGFTKEEFSENREKIYDTRYCFGYGYTFYEDNVDEFVRIYNSDDKNDTAYDVLYEEAGLIDVAAWFGAEKIYFYLKEKCNKRLGCLYLAIYGGNEKIINDCFNTEMSDYEKTRFVIKLLYDRHFDLAIKICDKNEVNNVKMAGSMFVPLDVIKRIKNAKVSGNYTSLDNMYLVSYWYSFIDDNNLDAEMPSFKMKLAEVSGFRSKPKEPTKLNL